MKLHLSVRVCHILIYLLFFFFDSVFADTRACTWRRVFLFTKFYFPIFQISALNIGSFAIFYNTQNKKIKIISFILWIDSHGSLFYFDRCAQCFRPFPDGIFYEFEGYKYCEHDFHVLFAPCCGKCGKLILKICIQLFQHRHSYSKIVV